MKCSSYLKVSRVKKKKELKDTHTYLVRKTNCFPIIISNSFLVKYIFEIFLCFNVLLVISFIKWWYDKRSIISSSLINNTLLSCHLLFQQQSPPPCHECHLTQRHNRWSCRATTIDHAIKLVVVFLLLLFFFLLWLLKK